MGQEVEYQLGESEGLNSSFKAAFHQLLCLDKSLNLSGPHHPHLEKIRARETVSKDPHRLSQIATPVPSPRVAAVG